MNVKRTMLEKLLAKFVITPNGCWEWFGGKMGAGYGAITKHDGKVTGAHRVSYEEFVGPIPPALEIDHLCRNKLCINPAHLEAVTPAENMKRVSRSRTHCNAGHAYTPENTYIRQSGKGVKVCRTCHRLRQRKDYVPKSQQAVA